MKISNAAIFKLGLIVIATVAIVSFQNCGTSKPLLYQASSTDGIFNADGSVNIVNLERLRTEYKAKSIAIIESKCMNCHITQAPNLTQDSILSSLIMDGNPEASDLYLAAKGSMKSRSKIEDAEIETIKQWIELLKDYSNLDTRIWSDVEPIIAGKCATCHNSTANIKLVTYRNVVIDEGLVVPKDDINGLLIETIYAIKENKSYSHKNLSPTVQPLNQAEEDLIKEWLRDGAPEF